MLRGRHRVHLLGTLILLGPVSGCPLDLLQPLIDVIFIALDLLIQMGSKAQIPPVVYHRFHLATPDPAGDLRLLVVLRALRIC